MKTTKLSRILLLATLIAASFATVAYSDSFVDESVMTSLKGFEFGKTVASAPKADVAVESVVQGDSFVGASAMAALENFHFGLEGYNAPRTVAVASENFTAGDSFVSEEAMDQLEGFVFLKNLRDDETSLSRVDTDLQ